MNSEFHISLEPGDVLFREGDAPTTAFLLDRGAVRVSTMHNGDIVVLADLGPGTLLGEMAVLDEAPRSATATALSACELTPIDRAQFVERLGDADPIVRALLLSQLSRYRRALAIFAGSDGAASVHDRVEADADDAHAHAKIRLESQLREALEQNRLDVQLQPIRHIVSGRIAGYEALTRWQHPERGAISPAEFIALAEETSLIVPVGEYVLDRVCRALQRFAQIGSAAQPFIALNVSGRQIEDPAYVERVLAQAQAHGVAPEQIKIEITESLMLDYPRVANMIARSHAAGIRVGLDDFGTGYSNLAHLHQLQFDTLKLDRTFVTQLEDPRCLAVVRAIITLGRALGCDIIAEGIETQKEFDQLRTLGCDYSQGYFTGRPMPIEAALQEFATENAGKSLPLPETFAATLRS